MENVEVLFYDSYCYGYILLLDKKNRHIGLELWCCVSVAVGVYCLQSSDPKNCEHRAVFPRCLVLFACRKGGSCNEQAVIIQVLGAEDCELRCIGGQRILCNESSLKLSYLRFSSRDLNFVQSLNLWQILFLPCVSVYFFLKNIYLLQ